MNYKSSITAAITALAFSQNPVSAELLHITSPGTSLVLNATEGHPLQILYYGDKVTDADLVDITTSPTSNHVAYPTYGLFPQNEAALSVTHADGNRTTLLEVTGVETTQTENATVTTVKMRDKYYPLEVDINYKVYPGYDIIETWAEITNNEDGQVTLNRFMSGYIPIRMNDVWLSSLYGSWANEAKVNEEPLQHGVKMIKNKDGVRNTQTAHAEVMFSLDGKPRENDGRVIGAALCYPGNYKLLIDTDDSNYHHFFAGINEENSEYHLKTGETFTTPELALTYSNDGLGGVSRNFHRWGRNNRLHAGDKERKILLNSWEGVYFNVQEDMMATMMEDIAKLGGELFVMDDGWFGNKYPRNIDTSSLGDWTVDTRKLTHGLNGLIETAKEKGVKFGIWIEPEMANTISELYDAHPEYIIKAANRDIVKGRGGTQVTLDLSNPKVQDLVFEVFDTLMTNYPEINYIKWDANASVMEHGSQYLTEDNQSHLYIDYHKGLQATLDRIRAAHPDVTIQACASGGGRVNWGFLPWFDEFWTSDNTDALQRLYIQWGTSYFFPAIAMASHISASPNHQTGRRVPAKFRADVAMSGRLGLEMQPGQMNEEDKEIVARAIEDYKKIRPIVQFGDLYRLQSPYDKKGVASLMYVTPDKDDAVFFWWKTESFVNQQVPRIPMAGLDPDKYYKITELNPIDNRPLSFEGKTFSGKFLMSNGLEMPLSHSASYNKAAEYASRVLQLTAIK